MKTIKCKLGIHCWHHLYKKPREVVVYIKIKKALEKLGVMI